MANNVANAGHKLTIPYFNGINTSTGAAISFLEKLESYRIMVGYEADQKVRLLPHALLLDALIWFDNEAERLPTIKTDWATFERRFKIRFGATVTISSAISARSHVKQNRTESVAAFYDRCRHIVRMTSRPFVSNRQPDIRNHPNYELASGDLKVHFSDEAVLYMFVPGMIQEIRRLCLPRTFETAEDVLAIALEAERALRTEGILKDPNTIAVSGHTDPRSGVTVFGAQQPVANQRIQSMYAEFNGGFEPAGSEEDAQDIHAVSTRGGARGRASRGRGRGRGGAQRQRPQCRHCKQMGHEEQTCWAKFPHLKPARTGQAGSASAISVEPQVPQGPSAAQPLDFHF